MKLPKIYLMNRGKLSLPGNSLAYFMGNSRFMVSALVLAIAILCRVTAAESAVEPLRIAVSQTPLSLPFYVAESQGYFRDEGLQIKISDVIGGHRTMQQLLEGKADLATSSESVVMFNSFQQQDFAVIASFVSSDDDSKVVVRPNAGITEPKHLAGKRVGTVVGGACHYYLEMMLLTNGVDPKKVLIRNLQPEDMADALSKGDVDAVAIWEPFPYKVIKVVPGSRVLGKSNAYRMFFNLIEHKRLLKGREEELVKLLRALERSEQFIISQPEKAKTILLNRLKLDNDFIDWIWPRNNYRLTLSQTLVTTLEGEARWARKGGLVKGDKSPNYLNFIDAAPLGKMNVKAVSIIR